VLTSSTGIRTRGAENFGRTGRETAIFQFKNRHAKISQPVRTYVNLMHLVTRAYIASCGGPSPPKGDVSFLSRFRTRLAISRATEARSTRIRARWNPCIAPDRTVQKISAKFASLQKKKHNRAISGLSRCQASNPWWRSSPNAPPSLMMSQKVRCTFGLAKSAHGNLIKPSKGRF
jgi:hypothetical protein